ncbi:hypothetical protein BTR23_25225 [Alkalihalophilus pseudofirmus]|nr:hypothetical protein BTR23_25225 [Alkalihalophilus pseudofirmus]
MLKTFELPKYQELSDSELAQWDNVEFAEKLLGRSYSLGEFLLHKDGYKIIDSDEETRRNNLAEYCLRTAWMEYWMGVNPAAKQLVILEKNPENINLSIRLSQQIIDEVDHQRTWCKWVKHFGGNPRIQDFQPAEDQLEMYKATFNFDDPVQIAASNQCTGEAILSYHLGGKMNPADSISFNLLPVDLRDDIAKSVVAQEPRHIAVGRDIIIKYATVEQRRDLLNIQVNKMKKWVVRALTDLRLLGAERTGPMPILD